MLNVHSLETFYHQALDKLNKYLKNAIYKLLEFILKHYINKQCNKHNYVKG